MERVDMDIVKVPFESKLIFVMNNQEIKLTAFLTEERGNIKIGIDAPRGVAVNREEIYIIKQKKLEKAKALEASV
jgi:carbon storage regulator